MKKLAATILLLFCIAGNLVFAQSSETIRNYIDQYKELAMQEMIRSGVPASITLAQGIHESAAGTSNLVSRSNNHFGIKCKAEWSGESVSHDDDAKGECFRKYADPADSYRDHSDFLKNRPFYKSLFLLDPTDYEGWAYGLKKAGYATNPKYPQILIKIIKDYNLDQYTLIALNRKGSDNTDWAVNTTANNDVKPAFAAAKKVTKQYPSGVFNINDTKVVFVSAGTSFLKLADEHNVSLSRLFDFNDMKPQDVAMNDQLVYLQRKRKAGASEFHTVADGETLHEIAQAEGIRLDALLDYNSLNEKMQPAAGEKLYLHSKNPNTPGISLGKAVQDLISTIKGEESTSLLHTVQAKETLYSISKQYDVEVEDVMKANKLQSTELHVGQQLKIQKIKSNGVNQSAR